MTTTRRDLLAGALTAAAAAVTSESARADDDHHDDGHEHQVLPPDPALRVKSLESLLIEKGLVDAAALDAIIVAHEHRIGPRNGARVVARAWVDPRCDKSPEITSTWLKLTYENGARTFSHGLGRKQPAASNDSLRPRAGHSAMAFECLQSGRPRCTGCLPFARLTESCRGRPCSSEQCSWICPRFRCLSALVAEALPAHDTASLRICPPASI